MKNLLTLIRNSGLVANSLKTDSNCKGMPVGDDDQPPNHRKLPGMIYLLECT